MSAEVTIRFIVPAGYAPGDYARLHGDGGGGELDWDTPLDNFDSQLFADGGICGWGLAPWGRHRFGHGHSDSSSGFGHLPFGRYPFGHGTSVVYLRETVYYCGDYKYALACYDASGNIHEGSAQELEVPIHTPPPIPTGLLKSSYDKETDVLVLEVA